MPSFRMRRALLAFGSESASEDRAREQVRRAADPSSQPPALHRSIGAWWPDDGSALYRWLTPVVIDRTRRGTHNRADANGPCRGCATAVSCRAASRTSRRACPCPVLLCTLHIGGANLKSRATCDSTMLPRSPTDVPAPSGQRRCRVHPNHCHKLQAEAIWWLLTSFRSVVAHAHASGGGVTDASLLLPAGGVHPVCMTYGTCSLQAHQPSRIGRQRPPSAWKSHASNRTRVYHTNMPDLARTFCAHSRPIPIRDQRQLQVGWARLARAMSLAPTISRDLRGRMRGVGATCTAPATHALSKRVPPQE